MYLRFTNKQLYPKIVIECETCKPFSCPFSMEEAEARNCPFANSKYGDDEENPAIRAMLNNFDSI